MCSVSYGVLAYDARVGIALLLLLPLWAVVPVTAARAAGLLERGIAGAFAVAAVWIASEVAFQEVLWLPLDTGTTQAHGSAPRELARLAGAAGLGFLIVACSALVAVGAGRAGESGLRSAAVPLGLAALLPVMASAPRLDAPAPAGPCRAEVAVVQPAVSPAAALQSWWDPASRSQIRTAFWHGIERTRGAALVVWPEGSGAFESMRIGPARDELRQWARAGRRHLFVSAIDFDERGRRFNSIFALDPAGALRRYDKLRPVPWAERSLTAGEGPAVISAAGRRAGLLICFESCFPPEARALAAAGADLLLVSTNDAAFGVSSLPGLHLSNSILRAVENGIPVVHASSSGPSAVIDARGTVVARTRLLERTELRACLPAAAPSAHARSGYLFRYACALAGLAALALGLRRRPRGRSERAFSPLAALGALAASAVAALALAAFNAWWVARDVRPRPPLGEIAASLLPARPASADLRVELRDRPLPGALELVAGYYGARADAALAPESAGPTLREVARAAGALGLVAERVHAPGGLETETLPVIAELDSGPVAVIESRGRHFRVYGRAIGFLDLPAPLLETMRRPGLLRVRPPPLELR